MEDGHFRKNDSFGRVEIKVHYGILRVFFFDLAHVLFSWPSILIEGVGAGGRDGELGAPDDAATA